MIRYQAISHWNLSGITWLSCISMGLPTRFISIATPASLRTHNSPWSFFLFSGVPHLHPNIIYRVHITVPTGPIQKFKVWFDKPSICNKILAILKLYAREEIPFRKSPYVWRLWTVHQCARDNRHQADKSGTKHPCCRADSRSFIDICSYFGMALLATTIYSPQGIGCNKLIAVTLRYAILWMHYFSRVISPGLLTRMLSRRRKQHAPTSQGLPSQNGSLSSRCAAVNSSVGWGREMNVRAWSASRLTNAFWWIILCRLDALAVLFTVVFLPCHLSLSTLDSSELPLMIRICHKY